MATKQSLTAYALATLANDQQACPCGNDVHSLNSRSYCQYHARFTAWLYDGARRPFSVFVKGNQKLPFMAFSCLPQITCPGAGECLTYCYSFKAWRNPGAFFRQLGNTVLLATEEGRDEIAREWALLPYGIDVRWGVDGDIANGRMLRFLFSLCESRQDLRVYGYSKSWAIFLAHADAGRAFPSNYVLNLSGGSVYGEAMRKRMEQLPITRGTFDAYSVASKMPNRRIDAPAWAAWAKALKATAKQAGVGRAYVCPGKCGDCMGNGAHACGTHAMDNITVLIGIH